MGGKKQGVGTVKSKPLPHCDAVNDLKRAGTLHQSPGMLFNEPLQDNKCKFMSIQSVWGHHLWGFGDMLVYSKYAYATTVIL